MSNVYYGAPEYLEHVLTLTDPNANYDFSDVMLVRDTRDKTLWAAHDAGCSCPTPFEDHRFPTDFEQVRSVEDLERFIDGQGTKYDRAEIDSMVAKARALLAEQE